MAYKILLIDDSQTQLDVFKMKLLKEGYEVETATNGTEGYQKVFTSAPDIVLSDILMPNLDGYQLCRLLKNNPMTSNIPVILLTVLDKKIDKFWGNKAGAQKFISKTADFEEIKKNVAQIVEQNPVSEIYKSQILSCQVCQETIQNQINSILNELLMKSTFLNEFRDLSEFLTHEKVLIEKTFALLSSFVDYNIGGIFFNNPDHNEKNILHLDICKNPVSNFVIEKVKRDFFGQMPGLKPFSITDYGHDIVHEKTDEDERILSADVLQSAWILPIMFEERLLGGVCFFSKDNYNYPDFKFYKVMVSELVALFKMKFLYSETEYLSVTDGLTGLYNRRHFEYNIEREFLRTKRYPRDLSLAILDIDFFKKVNDNYGHQFGDYVLKEVSKLLSQSFRKTDMIYRYGGEELTVILTETSVDNAIIPLERLRQRVEEHKFEYNGVETNLTISVGISTNFGAFEHVKQLVESADKALYKAKQTGRNKVIAYSYEQLSADI